MKPPTDLSTGPGVNAVQGNNSGARLTAIREEEEEAAALFGHLKYALSL